MENKDAKFWMSMIKKHEDRRCELEEQQCNLEQRLLNLKRKISSSQNDICSCCSQCFEPTPTSSRVRTNKPPVAPPKVEEFDDLSLNSLDMQYVSTLYEVIDREKLLKKQVHEMEMRERALLENLKPADQTCESRSRNFGINDESSGRVTYEKTIIKLKEENARLTGELEDVKLELKHCMEKYHGPMTRSLEQERRRSEQLENELKTNAEEMSTKECCYREDLCCLNSRMEDLIQNLTEISQENENLQRQLCSMGRKYKDLQRDLISQKLNEARTLERLNELLSEKERTVVRERRFKTQETQPVPRNDEKGKTDVPHNLYAIARNLSKTLLNINQCDICREAVPEDLKDTINGIKVITDIVERNSTKNDATKPNDKKPPDGGPGGGQFPLPPRHRDDPGDDSTGKTDDDSSYGGDTGKSGGVTEDLTDAPDLPTEDEVGAVAQSDEGDIHVLTEVEASGDLKVQVDTLVELSDDVGDDIHVTATVTSSGMLEVVTEGPAGIIETIMMRTPSGNLEVVTEIMDYPERLAIAESGDTSRELDAIEDVVEEPEHAGGSVYESIAEEDEFFSVPISDVSRGDVEEDGILAPIIEVEGETPSDEFEPSNFPDEEAIETDEVPMNGIVSRGPIRSVISDTTDTDRAKLGRRERRKKFMSKIPVSASFPYKGPVCNCGKCGCVECFGRIFAEPQGERVPDEKSDSVPAGKVCNLPDEVSLLTYTSVASARPTKPHPPDCDCVDCLCDPCASFPPDYATRVHPPGCDCIDCLCGEFPCATGCTEPKPATPVVEINTTLTEPSEKSTLPDERSIDLSQVEKTSTAGDGLNPEEVPVSANETKLEEKVAVPVNKVAPEVAPVVPVVERSVPAEVSAPVSIKEVVPVVERLVPAEGSGPVSIKQADPIERSLASAPIVIKNSTPVKQPQGEGEKLNHKAGCECDLCRCCNCGEVSIPQKCEDACDTGHRSNCSCIDCLLSCGFPKETPKAEGERIDHGNFCDCATCQTPCTSPTCAQIKEPRPADLQVCLDKLKCACLNAETTTCCEESQSGHNLLETLRRIMANLQEMCTAENMANIMNELRAKANRFLFSEVLPMVTAPSLTIDQEQDIYSCACKERKTGQSGAYLRNPCTCGTDVIDNIPSDSSSCSCFDQLEDESCCCLNPQNCEESSPMLTNSSVSLCSCTSYAEPQLICKKNAPGPTSQSVEITEVKKVASDGLLIKWTPPACQDVTGYEILIDGQVKSKVRSAFRTSAIIYSLRSGSLNLKVYATTPGGRCEPPANTMYQF